MAADLARRLGPKVELLPEWRWVWRAWHRLDDERQWRGGGMGGAVPGRIPWTAVAAWADRHGHSADDLAMLDRLICEMDAEYLDWCRASAKREANP